MNPRTVNRNLRLALGLILSGACLYLALRDVALGQVWEALSQADLRWAGLALACVAANTLLKASRWKVLLGEQGRQAGFFPALAALLVGQTLNTLLPARVGDLSRAYLLGGRGLGKTFVLGTVVLEKIVDMLSYACLFLFLLFLIPLPGWVSSSAYFFAGLALFVSAGVYLLSFRRAWLVGWMERALRRFPERIRSYTTPRFQSGLNSLEVLHDRRALLLLALLSAAVWATALLNNQLALVALGLRLPLTASLLVLVALMAGISIPSLPGKIGVFEYICVLSLGLFGVGQVQALTYGILLHAVVFLPSTLAGLLLFWLQRLDLRRAGVLEVS